MGLLQARPARCLGEIGNLLPNNHMLRIVPHTVPRVGRSYEHFPDGFELHLLPLECKQRLSLRFKGGGVQVEKI